MDFINDTIKDFISLQEAEFNDDKKTATITVIKEGWSKNKTNGKQRYYSAKSVESVVGHLGSSKKMYKDHNDKPRARYIDEWAATVTESWVVNIDGKKHAKASIDFTANPKTVWLYQEARKHPEEVGVSINGGGQIREGKIGDQDAAIIEDVIKLDSADFVTMAAAGGAMDRVTEGVNFDILSEVFKSLDNRVNDAKKADQPYQDYSYLMGALSSFISELMYTNEISTGDVGEEINKALDSFSDKIKGVIEEIRKRWEPQTKEHIERKDRMKLDDFKKDHSDAYAELEEQITLIAKNDAEKATKGEVEKMKTDLEQVQKDLKEAQDKIAEKEKALTDAQLKIDEFETKEAQAKKKELINGKIAEAKIPASDKFINLLMKLSDEEITEAINDRIETIKGEEGKVAGLGNKGKGKEDKPVFDEEKEKQMLYGK